MYKVLITTLVKNEDGAVLAVSTAVSQFETRREAIDVETQTNALPSVQGISYRAAALLD